MISCVVCQHLTVFSIGNRMIYQELYQTRAITQSAHDVLGGTDLGSLRELRVDPCCEAVSHVSGSAFGVRESGARDGFLRALLDRLP